MRILVTGMYEPKYNRTLIILNGLKKLGYDVLEYPYEHANAETARKIRDLSQNTVFTFLPSFTHKSVPFVKKHTTSPLVFDPLVSKYMTNVLDYKHYPPWSLSALKDKYRDKQALKNSDFIIFDTKAHQKYFLDCYKIDKRKTGVVYVGTNTNAFKSGLKLKDRDKLVVGFVGGFIPLHGIFVILDAAKILRDNKDICFKLIGTGFQYEAARKYAEEHQLSNVSFLGWVPYDELGNVLNQFDICLGIFGNNEKSHVVIPNKIFHYASCAKPVITMETQAIKEIFTHQENVFLTKPAGNDLAQAIIYLKNNPEIRTKIAMKMHNLVNDNFNETATAKSLITQFVSYIGKQEQY